MSGKNVVGAAAFGLFVYHLIALAVDAERWQVNNRRYQAVPNRANLLRLLLAEGVLIKDVGFLL